MLARAEQGAEDTVAGIAARNLAALTPSAGERAQARPAERATTRSSWVERLSVNTQLLVTRLAHIARRPEITSVTRPAAESASERPARRSEEHTSELQSLMRNSYAAFCLKKKQPNSNTDLQKQYTSTEKTK